MSMTDAVLSGASPEVLANTPLPEAYTAAHIRIEDEGLAALGSEIDVRQTIHIGEIPMPELAPDEVLVATMASAVNYNTVWSATFAPMSTFKFLSAYGRQGGWARRHDQPFHVLGSDAAGVIVRVGAGVRRWKIGDHVTVNPAYVDDQEPAVQMDGMLSEHQLAWGYETNYGGLGHYCVARSSQLIPKVAHLTWEEAATIAGCGGTAYRMLVSDRGARMKQGDVVLIWGASGGLGAYAVQLVKSGGGIAVGVVSSDRKAEAARALGCDVVINRSEIGIDSVPADSEQVVSAGKKLGRAIRAAVGVDPYIVFEHSGAATFGISVFVARRGGAVVTCGSSTGYLHQFDNRYLWMRLKRIIGSHIANLQEQVECSRLVELGMVSPVLSSLYSLSEIGEAARSVQLNEHIGKVGVLCMAPESGLGVTDASRRAEFAEEHLNPLRKFANNPVRT